MPHYDALVLTIYINDFDVHRVLVDPSNAADLLQLPAFKQMKPSLHMMNSTERILSGFKRATIVTLGVVTLPVKVGVDATRSTDRTDSLLNGRKNAKRKCGLIFEFWKIRPKGGTVLLWSRHLLLFLFLNGENQVRTKNPNDSSMEKKRSAKTRFLGSGIRLPIGKVPHMR